MKKSSQSKRGVQDSGHMTPHQPEKFGWIRKFYGRGIFRELWRSRYVMLRGQHLYICEKEVKDERKAQEVLDLADYERSEELRKAKSRSKKNHSRFTLLRRRQPGKAVPNLVFLAVSPEEKESWVNALNGAIVKAKNRVLDQVSTQGGGALAHPTRDRAKIPQGRRLPTRGHLLAVASTSSHGMLTLDLVAEEDSFSPDGDGDSQESWEVFGEELQGRSSGGSQGVGGRRRAGTDVSKLRATPTEPKVKTGSLPRGGGGSGRLLEDPKIQHTQQVLQSLTPQPGKRCNLLGRSRCASMDEVLSSRPAMIRSELRSALCRCPTEDGASGGGASGGGASGQPVGQLQSLIAQRMQRAQELLEEMRLQELQKAKAERGGGGSSPYLKSIDSPRLHHLRGSDSPPSSRSSGSPRSRSSDSPRLRGKDSPRPRARESPRSKAKKSRSKESPPRSRGGGGGGGHSPRLKDSPRSLSSDPLASPKLRDSSTSSELSRDDLLLHKSPDSPQLKGNDSPAPPPRRNEWPGRTSPTPSGSLESPQDKRCSTPPSEEQEVERRRAEAGRLLEEAVSSWKEAQEVLQEVKELQSQTLRRQRRKTYEKMTTADEEDTPTSPTSPEGEEETP